MSDDTEIKKYSNYYMNWLKQSISDGLIKYYEYPDFKNIWIISVLPRKILVILRSEIFF